MKIYGKSLMPHARLYLAVAEIIFVIAAIICIALLTGEVAFINEVDSYIIGARLVDGMLRMSAAAALMTVLIDVIERSAAGF